MFLLATLCQLAQCHVFVFTEMMQGTEGAAPSAGDEAIGTPMLIVLDIKDGQITDRWMYEAAE